MIAPAESGAVLGTLAAIALGVAGSSLARRRSQRDAQRSPSSAAARRPAASPIEIQLEGGPVFGRRIRFQALIASQDSERVRVRLRKLAGPDCPLPTPTWKIVESASGPELVIDGEIAFEAEDDRGQRFGEYELEIEVAHPMAGLGLLGRPAASAVQRFRVGYIETFRRPAHAIFSGSNSWSTTSRGELKGQGPSSGETGTIKLKQGFAGHAELAVRTRARYELGREPRSDDQAPLFEIELAGSYTARIQPGHATPVELRHGQQTLASGNEGAPLFLGHGERCGELRLDFRLRREGPRARLLLFVDGLLVRSAYVPATPPEGPWTVALACRGLTVFVEELEASPPANPASGSRLDPPTVDSVSGSLSRRSVTSPL